LIRNTLAAAAALLLAACSAAPAVAPREYPGHRNAFANYFNLRTQEPWTWYRTVRAHDYCNVVILPDLHPFSLKVLYVWHRGLIGDDGLRQLFHMPNSDYLGAADCIIRQRSEPRPWVPRA
jgi:hypothetical protein